MALCQRCYKSPPIYDCSICKGYYCLSCDEYIHSFPSKKLHTRRILDVATAINTESPKQTEENINNTEANINVIKETLPIYDSNIGKSSTIFNSDYTKYEKGPFIDIDEKYLQGNTNIEDKIEELTCNLENTKINLSERIDVLDDHIHKINEINKDDLININSRNLKEINDITSEKDYEINQLQLIIEKQKEKIRELKDVNRMLENELINSIKLKNQSLKERDEALDDKKAQEKAFIKDLDEMILSQEDEKKKLVNGYEDKFIKTNSDYHDEKDKLLNELKAIQENFEKNEQLKKEEENLKENLKRTKTKIDEIEEEMKSNDLVNLQWAKELETMSTKTEQIKKANTILGKSCFRSAYRPEV